MKHVVLPPRQGASGTWHAACICGAAGSGDTHDEAREQLDACRRANGAEPRSETREQRQMRARARREQRRSRTEGRGRK